MKKLALRRMSKLLVGWVYFNPFLQIAECFKMEVQKRRECIRLFLYSLEENIYPKIDEEKKSGGTPILTS